jgi:hypothetical protein
LSGRNIEARFFSVNYFLTRKVLKNSGERHDRLGKLFSRRDRRDHDLNRVTKHPVCPAFASEKPTRAENPDGSGSRSDQTRRAKASLDASAAHRRHFLHGDGSLPSSTGKNDSLTD